MPIELQLPACQKCKLRKVRCDRRAPKCSNCTRGAVACIVVDAATGEHYARDYIRQLEEEELKLKEQLELNGTGGLPAPTPSSDNAESIQRDPMTKSSMAGQSQFVGDGSGLGFLHNILSDPKWEQHRARIFSQLAARPRMQRQHLTPNPFPPFSEAEQLLENYFTRFHIHHTFLLRQEVLEVFGRIYDQSDDTEPPVQDRFRLFMVFAISATTRHRAGLSSENPYGYFMAAEACLRSIPLIKNVEAIQNLLLVARFGMYHHIGTSLWEISQLCMRQCIEWQLHIGNLDNRNSLDLLTEQHRRRIFWESYILDRYSSGILGRPFAIRESDITIGLPIDVDDATLANTNAPTLDLVPSNTSSGPTELSIFIHCIKLRQISSRIHTEYFTGRGQESLLGDALHSGAPTTRFKSIGHLYTCFSRFYDELRAWRSNMAVFPNPRALYERPEWHDFMYEKDLMLLARGAMYNALSCSYTTGQVTKKILATCYESASRVIQLYAYLMEKQAITWTRSYFQVIFTAGLTVIYCVSLDQIDAVPGDEKHYETLNLCNEILGFFKVKMPDAESFAIVFDILKDECIEHRLRTGSQVRNSSSDITNDVLGHNSSVVSTSPGFMDTTSYSMQSNLDNLAYDSFNPMLPYNVDTTNFGLGLTDNFGLITQLEAGLCEYAWGWISTENDTSGQMPFY